MGQREGAAISYAADYLKSDSHAGQRQAVLGSKGVLGGEKNPRGRSQTSLYLYNSGRENQLQHHRRRAGSPPSTLNTQKRSGVYTSSSAREHEAFGVKAGT